MATVIDPYTGDIEQYDPRSDRIVFERLELLDSIEELDHSWISDILDDVYREQKAYRNAVKTRDERKRRTYACGMVGMLGSIVEHLEDVRDDWKTIMDTTTPLK